MFDEIPESPDEFEDGPDDLLIRHEQEAAAVLGIPDTVTQVALLPVAYYTGDDFKQGSRLPAEKVTYFNRWKQQ